MDSVPNLKLIATYPDYEQIKGIINYRDMLIVCTERNVYELDVGECKLKPINYGVDNE